MNLGERKLPRRKRNEQGKCEIKEYKKKDESSQNNQEKLNKRLTSVRKIRSSRRNVNREK